MHRESNKYENTIETDDDFKTFLETKRMTEEEWMNRPKPPPGGGVVSSITKDSKGENGQPVAAYKISAKRLPCPDYYSHHVHLHIRKSSVDCSPRSAEDVSNRVKDA